MEDSRGRKLDGASSGRDLTLYLEDRAGTPHDIFHSGSLLTSRPGAEPPAMMVDDPRTLPELAVAQYAADGSVVTLGQDVRRARFRDGFFRQELLRPQQVVTIPFSFNWMAWRIPGTTTPAAASGTKTRRTRAWRASRSSTAGSRASALSLPLAALSSMP